MPPLLATLGTLAMHLLLVLLFYGVLTPLAIVLRVLRIDVIGARRDERAKSYWRKRNDV